MRMDARPADHPSASFTAVGSRPSAPARAAWPWPTGPAPMTTTSYIAFPMSVGLRRAAETDGRDEEEDGAGDGVADRVGQRRVLRGRGRDERPTYGEGIHSVGVDRIITEAKVTRATFYRHFPGKE